VSEVSVVYISGDGRSGSTLLDVMLDQVPGFVAVGEINYVWERGLLKNEPCGCGAPFRDCPFWRDVGVEAFGGWDAVDLPELLRLEQSVTRLRRWPLLIASRALPRVHRDAVAYALHMQRLYVAAAHVSGSPFVVDSSKNPGLALLLLLMPEVRPRIVHMVRDSRGVAFSWTRRVLRAEALAGSADSHMPMFSSWESGLVWTVKNLQHEVMKASGIPHHLLRYESLIADPRAEVERLLSYARAPQTDLSFLDGGRLELGSNHTVSGNPVRFKRGPIALSLDDEWRGAMSRADRGRVVLLTWPLLLAYGYFWAGAPGAAARGYSMAVAETSRRPGEPPA
jgi:hypothetical protein